MSPLPGITGFARLHSAAARLALQAAVLAAVVLPALVSPLSARAAGPLPACRYDDVLTTPRAYEDWAITLVDTILRVPKAYEPPDLVPTSQAGITGGGTIRAVVIEDLRAMTEAAAAADAAIGLQSAYRSYAEQKVVFDRWVRAYGYDRALEVSARPGHSEHQLGLAIDVRSEPGGSPFNGSWASTPAGSWMRLHAWEYGFVMSYPRGSMEVTCYDHEPWHFRYVGRELAAAITASGLTQREYLWANYTTTIVPPLPRPTPTPGSTTKPTAAPTAEPTTEPASTTEVSATPTVAPPTLTPPPTAAPPAAQPTPAETAAPVVPPAGGAGPLALAGAAAIGVAVLLAGALLWRRGRTGGPAGHPVRDSG